MGRVRPFPAPDLSTGQHFSAGPFERRYYSGITSAEGRMQAGADALEISHDDASQPD
jgi:hypothetical protein